MLRRMPRDGKIKVVESRGLNKKDGVKQGKGKKLLKKAEQRPCSGCKKIEQEI